MIIDGEFLQDRQFFEFVQHVSRSLNQMGSHPVWWSIAGKQSYVVREVCAEILEAGRAVTNEQVARWIQTYETLPAQVREMIWSHRPPYYPNGRPIYDFPPKLPL